MQRSGTRLQPFTVGACLLAFMLFVSILIRWGDIKREAGAPNADATYHVLLTIKALGETPASEHHWLPIVTLGNKLDRGVRWGGALRTQSGAYIYTSFPPAGFLAPYFAGKLVGAAPSVRTLAYFNIVLGSLSAFIVFALLVRVLALNGATEWVAVGGALAGAAITIFSREALMSHGLVYWSHCLYQPVLAAALYCYFRYLTEAPHPSQSSRYAWALVTAVFLGALIEWTAYVFSAGLVVILWLDRRQRAGISRLVTRIVLATTVAGVLTVVQYGLALDFSAAISGFAERAQSRSTGMGSVVALLQGYGASYGLFLLVLFALLVVPFIAPETEPATESRSPATVDATRVTALLFAAACVPLVENIGLLQHATLYSFDRLKFAYPAALLLALAFLRMRGRMRAVLAALVAVASLQGVASYRFDLFRYSAWTAVHAGNVNLARQIENAVDTKCAIFSSDQDVRGYANVLFKRAIYELRTLQASEALRIQRGACASVHLEAVWIFPELREYRSATITGAHGGTLVLRAEKPQ